MSPAQRQGGWSGRRAIAGEHARDSNSVPSGQFGLVVTARKGVAGANRGRDNDGAVHEIGKPVYNQMGFQWRRDGDTASAFAKHDAGQGKTAVLKHAQVSPNFASFARRRVWRPAAGVDARPTLTEPGRYGSLVAPIRYWSMRSEEHTSELQSLRHLVCR